jgi:hypothetical protein
MHAAATSVPYIMGYDISTYVSIVWRGIPLSGSFSYCVLIYVTTYLSYAYILFLISVHPPPEDLGAEFEYI